MYTYFLGLTKRILIYNLETEAYMLSRDSNEYTFTFFYFLRSLLQKQSLNLLSLLYFVHDVYGVNVNIQKALRQF